MDARSSVHTSGSFRPAGCGSAAAHAADQGRRCFECAAKGRSCCQRHDIFVTWGDCLRISAQIQRKDLYEVRKCGNRAYADQDDDPIRRQHVFRSDGTRRVLRQKPNGDCSMLTPEGCILPLTVRPLICRLYPHLYSAHGLAPEWDAECPVVRNCLCDIKAVIAGVSQHQAVQWHQLLYHEVLWEDLVDASWFNL